MKITKLQLKKIIIEAYKELTPARPVHAVQYKDPAEPAALLAELFNIRSRAKKIEQYEVAGHIDAAINALEISISSGSKR